MTTGELLEERREENGTYVWIAKDPSTNAIVARFASNDPAELDKMVQMWKAAEVAKTRQSNLNEAVSS